MDILLSYILFYDFVCFISTSFQFHFGRMPPLYLFLLNSQCTSVFCFNLTVNIHFSIARNSYLFQVHVYYNFNLHCCFDICKIWNFNVQLKDIPLGSTGTNGISIVVPNWINCTWSSCYTWTPSFDNINSYLLPGNNFHQDNSCHSLLVKWWPSGGLYLELLYLQYLPAKQLLER